MCVVNLSGWPISLPGKPFLISTALDELLPPDADRLDSLAGGADRCDRPCTPGSEESRHRQGGGAKGDQLGTELAQHDRHVLERSAQGVARRSPRMPGRRREPSRRPAQPPRITRSGLNRLIRLPIPTPVQVVTSRSTWQAGAVSDATNERSLPRRMLRSRRMVRP